MDDLYKILPFLLSLISLGIAIWSKIENSNEKLRNTFDELRDDIHQNRQDIAVLGAQRNEDLKNFEKLDDKLDNILGKL